MSKKATILHRLTAVATVLLTVLLCHQCIDIYMAGNRPENLVNGVYISPVFSAEIVAGRLLRLAPILIAYALLVVIALIFSHQSAAKHSAPRPVSYTAFPQAGAIRLVLAGLAVVFIILGVMNGGARDVLVKAINICTECIGLG